MATKNNFHVYGNPNTDFAAQEQQETHSSFLSWLLKFTIAVLVVSMIVYVLSLPTSPLRAYLDPKTVPKVPFLPDPDRESKAGGFNTAVIVMVGLGACIAVAVFLLEGELSRRSLLSAFKRGQNLMNSKEGEGTITEVSTEGFFDSNVASKVSDYKNKFIRFQTALEEEKEKPTKEPSTAKQVLKHYNSIVEGLKRQLAVVKKELRQADDKISSLGEKLTKKDGVFDVLVVRAVSLQVANAVMKRVAKEKDTEHKKEMEEIAKKLQKAVRRQQDYELLARRLQQVALNTVEVMRQQQRSERQTRLRGKKLRETAEKLGEFASNTEEENDEPILRALESGVPVGEAEGYDSEEEEAEEITKTREKIAEIMENRISARNEVDKVRYLRIIETLKALVKLRMSGQINDIDFQYWRDEVVSLLESEKKVNENANLESKEVSKIAEGKSLLDMQKSDFEELFSR